MRSKRGAAGLTVASQPADAAPGDSSGAATDAPRLPAKEYFKIGEAAELVGVKPHVLRYWEGEFKRDIRPDRTPAGQRMYRRRDVEIFLEIKRLRYEEKLEIGGARRKLHDRLSAGRTASAARTMRKKPSAAEAVSDLFESDLSEKASADSESDTRALAALRLRIEKGLQELLRVVDEDEKRG